MTLERQFSLCLNKLKQQAQNATRLDVISTGTDSVSIDDIKPLILEFVSLAEPIEKELDQSHRHPATSWPNSFTAPKSAHSHTIRTPNQQGSPSLIEVAALSY
jgi:hypothetical protein